MVWHKWKEEAATLDGVGEVDHLLMFMIAFESLTSVGQTNIELNNYFYIISLINNKNHK